MNNITIKLLGICFLMLCIASKGSAQELEFTYDAAGNQIKREWMCLNCNMLMTASTKTTPVVEKIAEAPKLTNGNQDNNQKVIAYPNPLTETLNIKWLPLKTHITEIQIYSMTGVNFFSKAYRYEEAEFHESIQFTKMTAGMYVVKVTFSDGKLELIKVVKQ
jgi:hypothetical protein